MGSLSIAIALLLRFEFPEKLAISAIHDAMQVKQVNSPCYWSGVFMAVTTMPCL